MLRDWLTTRTAWSKLVCWNRSDGSVTRFDSPAALTVMVVARHRVVRTVTVGDLAAEAVTAHRD
ncbi:MAG TPA: hypothetical protein VFC00_10670 [Micromonosporaceae bacterium]|nr:hypothetical protein [Micromonosporaceae bacterium]